ncbi:topoisomerase II-associated protein PAT1 [Kockovaella imperatae]|uniref:Topoisomerase II-associated protein PAT1 n=1 Tax=Kockovaella imperatae TaxID=4999 RepID=A0A1Y1UV21_9TREE|nr:topoisomerase II-associated protein PAT1 [Kockovaella imperatae]ORX41065.1 topoisomerase II-associated protein PAT1 [Kockovaella imperatae]
MSGGFFGFDASLPERRDQPGSVQGQGHRAGGGGGAGGFTGFQASNTADTFRLHNAGAEEDLAVYQWGDNIGGSLLEGGDEMNDETFGDVGAVGNDFQFSSYTAAPSTKPAKIASTQSRYGPKKAYDPFAASEDDFYASRPTGKKATKPVTKTRAPAPASSSSRPAAPSQSLENLWDATRQPVPTWSTGSTSIPASQTSAPASHKPPPSQIKSLEEIEAEMANVAVDDVPSTDPSRKVLTLEEIEQQMMETAEPVSAPVPPPHAQVSAAAIPREATPTQTPGLAGSGYASQQALLDSMFPELGSAAPQGPTASFAPAPGQGPISAHPTEAEMARYRELHDRLREKIASMAKYNNLMGSSDKDFITRIQLSQLATADPYTSDFYAQVFSTIQRSRMAAMQGASEPDGPSVVQFSSGLGFGVGGPNASRFGKMGQNTMQKLTSQVKKLVDNRQQRANSIAALQGALGKVTRGGSTGPRPVLAVPMPARNEARPASALNQQSGIRRQALTKKQVMFALEELYDSVLELEQKRRDMPPPTAMEEIQRWNDQCGMMSEIVWKRLMVMEPLDVSKGQRLFNRLLRHLSHQQCLTLLTLLIATYPQLDVVAHAPPPPVTDSSLLTKADRADRARREAETDGFLHNIIPGVDMIINRCSLALVAGLLGLCSQRMEVWKVATTRPGVALFTALLSRAQSIKGNPVPDPTNPAQSQGPEATELDQWARQYAYFLQTLLPHLPSLFPSAAAQRAAFGPTAYLIGGDKLSERDSIEMERRDAEVWGFMAALAVNAPEEEQMNLVAALREKLARNPSTPPVKRDMMLRNVNMFLNGLSFRVVSTCP